MGDERDRKENPQKTKKAEDRRARLERALRANLLKRKAKARAGKVASTPPKEGRQS